MLRILGSPKKLCGGWTRREMLWAGGLGLFGLGLPDYLRLSEVKANQTANAPPSRSGKAKSCILLYLYGAPSQLETFYPKPDAPVEIRGKLNPIRSNLPAIAASDLLPNIAPIMNHPPTTHTITHPYPIHPISHAS